MTSPLDPRVRDGWDAFNGPLEALDIDTLYDDTKGLPTVATGVLVASIAAMQSMAWLRPDGTRATPAEEAAEWERVDHMRPALVWTSPEWPHLQACLDAKDWPAAAAAGQMTWQGNPGTSPRDLAIAALFLLAGGATWAEARAGWPAGPAAETAARALAGLGLKDEGPGAEAPSPRIPAGPSIMLSGAVARAEVTPPRRGACTQDAPPAPVAQEPDPEIDVSDTADAWDDATPVTHGEAGT